MKNISFETSVGGNNANKGSGGINPWRSCIIEKKEGDTAANKTRYNTESTRLTFNFLVDMKRDQFKIVW